MKDGAPIIGFSEDEVKGLAVRLLIHYVGDIHQPLHCIEKLVIDPTTNRVIGDKGGKQHSKIFTVATDPEVTNLHQLWDSGIYQFNNETRKGATAYIAQGVGLQPNDHKWFVDHAKLL